MILKKTALKKSSLLLLSGMLLPFASGFSNDGSAQASENAETVKLVAATINPRGSLLADALIAFGDEIENQSDGTIEVNVRTDGILGSASSQYQSVISGDIDMIYSDSGWFAEQHPVFEVLSSHYLFKDREHFESIVNTEGKLSYFEDLLVERPGLKTVMYAGGLERNIISTFPINGVEDLQGRTMRSGTGATELEWWRNLGANPTNIDFNEVYSALQTGVVEGSQNSLDAMIQQRFGEVAKHVARTQHSLTLGFVVMNNERYESLSDEQKEAIQRAADIVQPEYISRAFEQAKEDMETLENEFGVTFTNPEREGFVERSRLQLDELAARYDVEDIVEETFN
ncbi:TRAP transporter substrate-binding protein [Halomonas sp. M5N1S17]|uniref:TRAP transporter substrate-binding protein n=1 Tax=Halomonas alkalisoli TaxID=2907158 RepID=UPI001F45D3B9|nr:TRAP transporter substrate-binding protein [Halomonas alkalisoli]MCE9663520.1 TRAP transporter substrate-binding protein [Halomonas alkalisoli]